jgi:outer membrane protein TolC
VSYLSLLDAQRTYQQTRVALVQAQAARYADSAALFQALGGGWWNRTELADISTPAGAAGSESKR